MDEKQEQIVKFEIEENKGIFVFFTNYLDGPFSISLFLCEIYEKLQNRFENGINENQFFNYQDPHGAWVLLDDYFQKTDFLKTTTLREFEDYRSRYGIALDFKKGECEQKNDMPIRSESVLAFKRFSNELDRWRIFDKESFDNAVFNPNIFLYNSCRSMIDFTFSLVHYLVFNKYKIARCAHCGHLFATKNLKEKYCLRSSPLAGYESYSCKAAVKASKDTFEKKRLSEYERLRRKADEYGIYSKHYDAFTTFCETCNDYKERLKDGATVDLLQEYRTYLFDSGNVRPKYQRLKNW